MATPEEPTVETVVVTKAEYESLLDDSRKLQYLEIGGVDNWEWYGEALAPYWEEKNSDE